MNLESIDPPDLASEHPTAAKVATGLSIAANFLLCVANVFVYLLLSTDSRYGTYCEDPSIFIIGCAAFNMAVSVVAVVMLHLLRWPLPQPPPPHYLPRTATIMAVVLFGQFVWQCLGIGWYVSDAADCRRISEWFTDMALTDLVISMLLSLALFFVLVIFYGAQLKQTILSLSFSALPSTDGADETTGKAATASGAAATGQSEEGNEQDESKEEMELATMTSPASLHEGDAVEVQANSSTPAANQK